MPEEVSTIHIKAPHWVHIGAKVRAAETGVSMNQHIIDLIIADMVATGIGQGDIQLGIDLHRTHIIPDKELAEHFKSNNKSYALCKHNAVKGMCKKGCK